MNRNGSISVAVPDVTASLSKLRRAPPPPARRIYRMAKILPFPFQKKD